MIEFYPDSIVKRLKPVAEQLQTPDSILITRGSQNLAGTGMSVSLWNKTGWEARRIGLHFDASVAKNYSIGVAQGKGVVQGKCDKLWFKVGGAIKDVYLTEGFYTGATLAAHLEAVLTADPVMATIAPFTVTYNAATSLFTIAAGGGSLQYLNVNTGMPVFHYRSTAGGLIGFTADSVSAGSITGNVAVPNLGTTVVFVSGAASSSQDVMSTDIVALSLDNALSIVVSAVATVGRYEVAYRLFDI